MRTVTSIATLIIGIIGAFDGVVVNAVVSIYRHVADALGGNADPSHGIIGFGLCLLGLIGAVLVVRWPLAAAVLLAIAGIGFAFVVHWWAVLASPQFLVAAALAFEVYSESRMGEQPGGRGKAQPAA
jgi:hypothetical protein